MADTFLCVSVIYARKGRYSLLLTVLTMRITFLYIIRCDSTSWQKWQSLYL